MSQLDLYNALRISDIQQDITRGGTITELSQRAEYIANNTGAKPKSWYEFKVENQEKVNTSPVKSALVGALIGMVIGTAAMLAIASGAGIALSSVPVLHIAVSAIGAAITGAILGQNMEIQRENNSNDKLVSGYNAYLGGFEKSNSKSRSIASEINYRNDHAERLKSQTSQLAR